MGIVLPFPPFAKIVKLPQCPKAEWREKSEGEMEGGNREGNCIAAAVADFL